MGKKDRRWSVNRGTGNERVAIRVFDGAARCVASCNYQCEMDSEYEALIAQMIAGHNAAVDALEAENAKLRAVVEVVCEGPVTAPPGETIRRLFRLYDDVHAIWNWWYRVSGALDMLVEEGDDGQG